MTAPPLEYRGLECRLDPVSDDGTITGTALKFDVVDSYNSTFAPGSFAGVRAVPMLWSHDVAEVIGRWTDVRSDASGLTVKGRLNLDVQRAREVRSLLQAGDVAGLSIGFRSIRDEFRGGVRRILKAELREISVVAFASVPGASVHSIRSGADLARLTTTARDLARLMKG